MRVAVEAMLNLVDVGTLPAISALRRAVRRAHVRERGTGPREECHGEEAKNAKKAKQARKMAANNGPLAAALVALGGVITSILAARSSAMVWRR